MQGAAAFTAAADKVGGVIAYRTPCTHRSVVPEGRASPLRSDGKS
jgi:hypothetical protein